MRGHVRKRGSKWCFVLDIGTDPETGKRKQKWFSGFNTKKEAEKEMVRKMNELEKGTLVVSTNITLGEYLENWLLDFVKGAVKPTTFESYSRLIRTYIIPSLGSLTLEKLHATHIQRFYNKMLEDGRTVGNGGLSSGTIQKLHGILRTALNHAVKWQLVSRNVVILTEPPRIHKKEIFPLEIEEVKQLLFYAKNDRYYIAFLLAITAGLRRGEILGLRWKDVDLDARTASICKNLVLVNNKPVLQEPKTRRSARLVTLPYVTVQALLEHKQKQDREKLRASITYQDYDLIVATSLGTPVNPRNLIRNFEQILKVAGLPRIRFHDLRHTHATLMLRQGEHPKVISERLGHSNISITMDTYSHVIPNMQFEAVDRFERMLFNDEEKPLF